MANRLITLDNAVAAYKNKIVLGPISVAIDRGDFIGIVGPNGSGKTTLLRLISGQAQLSGQNTGLTKAYFPKSERGMPPETERGGAGKCTFSPGWEEPFEKSCPQNHLPEILNLLYSKYKSLWKGVRGRTF